jgi:NAD dependent epimerase/dehydratase family enzyme
VAAVRTDDLSGGYDVADDRPLTRAELAAALSAVTGRARVRRPPTWLVRASLGARMSFLLRSQRVSNEAFGKASGWAPEVPDAVTGLRRLRGHTA